VSAGEKELKKRTKERMFSNSYITMPHYFSTEQVDIVRKMRPKRRRKAK